MHRQPSLRIVVVGVIVVGSGLGNAGNVQKPWFLWSRQEGGGGTIESRSLLETPGVAVRRQKLAIRHRASTQKKLATNTARCRGRRRPHKRPRSSRTLRLGIRLGRRSPLQGNE